MIGRMVVLGVLLTAVVLFILLEHLGSPIHTHALHPSAAPRWSATHGHPPRPSLIGVDGPVQTAAEDAGLSMVLH
jgi:hypothetical protein